MKKIKQSKGGQVKNTPDFENNSENQIPIYEADDGMITDEYIEAIKKVVPQDEFKCAESLF